MGKAEGKQICILGIGYMQLLNTYLIQLFWWFQWHLVFNKNYF